jgi:hypothetical protein
MGKARFKLSTHRLEQLLGLPYETRITEVIQLGKQFYPKELLIYVEHQDLPDNIEIFPQWNDKTRKEFVDWGIPK